MNQDAPQQTAPEQRMMMAAVLISLAGHILLFGASHLLSKSTLKATKQPKAVEIDLVNTELPTQKSKTKKSATSKTAAPAKKASKPAKKTSVSVKKPSKSKAKRASKKTITSNTAVKRNRRVVTPEELVQSALKQIEREQKQNKPDPGQALSERLKKMRQEVKNTEAKKASGPSDGVNASGKKSAAQASAIERYYQSVRVIIRSNWAFPTRPDTETSLQAQVSFTIHADGTIRDPWMVERSGNGNFDRSAISAVLKSSPLPPFPAGVKGKSMPIVMIFNEQDLQP